jgi:hypothetical protein
MREEEISRIMGSVEALTFKKNMKQCLWIMSSNIMIDMFSGGLNRRLVELRWSSFLWKQKSYKHTTPDGVVGQRNIRELTP